VLGVKRGETKEIFSSFRNWVLKDRESTTCPASLTYFKISQSSHSKSEKFGNKSIGVTSEADLQTFMISSEDLFFHFQVGANAEGILRFRGFT
jgi:hypothetical protein